MKTLISSILIALSTSIATAQTLPSEAKALLQQLQKFEDDTNKQTAEQIAAARKKAATMLEAHMVTATKAGDLDSALAIKAKIADLQGQQKAVAQTGAAKPAPDINSFVAVPPKSASASRPAGTLKTPLEQVLDESEWPHPHGKYVISNGKVTNIENDMRGKPMIIEVVSENEIRFELHWNPGEVHTWKFNDTFTEVIATHDRTNAAQNGGKLTKKYTRSK